MALEAISQRKDQRIRFEAAIHGINLDSSLSQSAGRVELSEAERAALDRETELAIERKRREMRTHV